MRCLRGPARSAQVRRRGQTRDLRLLQAAFRLSGCDRVISDEAKRKTPPVLHPLVHIHPITGRKALYLDSTTTIGIDGMDEASGSALLEEIYDFATQSEFVYRHHWQV